MSGGLLWLIEDMLRSIRSGWLPTGHVHYAHGVPWYSVVHIRDVLARLIDLVRVLLHLIGGVR